MTIFKIDTPQDFFEHIVSTDVSDFLNRKPALRTAYHACNSLLSYRDWIFATYKGKRWRHLGIAHEPFSSRNQFQKALERADTSFAIVADIANAAKHLILETNRAGLKGNSDTQIEIVDGTVNGAPINTVAINETLHTIYVNIGERRHDVVASVRNVHDTWVKLNAENRW